jgi:Domain of unknown function (DUF4340)
MKNNRSTLILAGLFFAILIACWGLQRAGVLTDKERRLRETRILPALIDVPELSVQRVEIDRGKERLVFERRGQGMGRWSMVEPVEVAVQPTHLETLVRNLKELRKSPDSGNVAGPPDSFGLAPPVATVKLWGAAAAESQSAAEPIAALALGKTVRNVQYVRDASTEAIEVADPKLLSAVGLPLNDWRERVVMAVPSFQVASVTIRRPEQVIRAERGKRGQWRLSAPINVPANPAKVESLIAALSSLRVVDGDKGFVADNVKDFAPFGLVSPLTIEMTTTRPGDSPLVLHVGKPVPDQPERIYVRQGDQDDVVIVDAKALSEVPTGAAALRSQRVADIEPAAVTEIQIETKIGTFAVSKRPNQWELTSPRTEKADSESVMALLNRIDALQASEFFEPSRIGNAELDPPVMTIKIWESARAPSGTSASVGEPALVLRIGKHDALRKTVFARLDNDQVILALPDTILEVLPRNAFAFRDLEVLSLNPADIRKLTITRGVRIDELEPDKNGEPNRWRLLRPTNARADVRSVTQVIAVLSRLRADQFVSDSADDLKKFGLDHPVLEIAWESDRAHRLVVGSPVPRSSAYYAKTDDLSFIFTIKTEVLKPFEAEFRDHTVLSFPAAKAQRVVLRWTWPKRDVAFRQRVQAAKGQPEWVDEPGSDAAGIDQSRISPLVKALSQLETPRFVQYDGEIPPATGLLRPRLTVEVELGSPAATRVIRIGYPTNDGYVFAAEGTSSSGPVFLLTNVAWDALIASGERFNPLPANAFAPAP